MDNAPLRANKRQIETKQAQLHVGGEQKEEKTRATQREAPILHPVNNTKQ